MTKRLLCPPRLRRVPRQFSWIDHRLLRDGHFGRCGGPPALALYLLLVTAADAQGLSYYSDKSAVRLLALSAEELRAARRALLAAGLIAYEAPLYQVLSLEPPVRPAEPVGARVGEPRPLGEILRGLFAAAAEPKPRQP